MNGTTERAAAWVYRGVWRGLSDWFRVPNHPPTLPVEQGEAIESFHPSPRYLSYLKLYFWIALVLVDLAIVVGWVAVFLWNTKVALWLAAPAIVVAVLPDIVAYVAIHLRYDTMWYVMSDRSLRCRRGIWVIVEHTITFENVQDVHVRRGPLQYLFGISTIIIETAGAAAGEGKSQFAVGNKAIMEGIEDPTRIRKMIRERVQRSRTAGLGDEQRAELRAANVWTEEQLDLLREMLASVRALG